MAVVDKDKCKSCGQCVLACPRHIIEMVPEDAGAIVECNSKEFGKDVKAVCSAGCIGCGLCTVQCEFDAIHLNRELPECSNMWKSEDKMKAVLPYALKRKIKITFSGNKNK
mgnify:CR=1 FL=1